MKTVVNNVEQRVQSIMAPFAQPWRWFCDGAWIVLEPPQGLVAAETVQYLHQHADTHTVEVVFRATPHPGVYLRFQLHSNPLSPNPRSAKKESSPC